MALVSSGSGLVQQLVVLNAIRALQTAQYCSGDGMISTCLQFSPLLLASHMTNARLDFPIVCHAFVWAYDDSWVARIRVDDMHQVE
jgi:hypothetical protein